MKLIGIARVSTKKQKESGDSVDSQIRRIKEFCQVKNHELVDIIGDDAGKSASIKEDKMLITLKDDRFIIEYNIKSRTDLKTILKNADSDRFDGITFFKWDRLFRSPPFAKAVQIYLENKGKKLIPTDDPEDPFASDIIQVVSKYEIDKNKSRIKLVRQQRFEKGMFVARPPVGYKLNKVKKTIEIDEKKAKMIKQVFELTLQGIDYKEICKTLELYPTQYYNIIRNRAYCGFVTFEGIEKKGNHKPIVSEKIWEKVNKN